METVFAIASGFIVILAPFLYIGLFALPALIIWWSKYAPVHLRVVWVLLAGIPLWAIQKSTVIFHFLNIDQSQEKILAKSILVLFYVISIGICVAFKLMYKKPLSDQGHP